MKFIKEFQIIKDPLKIDKPITNKIDRYKIWAIHLCKNNLRAENKDYGKYVW